MPRFNMTITTDTPAAKARVEAILVDRQQNGLKATVLRDEPGEMVIAVNHPQIDSTTAAAAFASDFAGMNPHMMASAVMCV